MNSEQREIYIKLLDEGIDVWRPAQAFITEKEGYYKIAPVDPQEMKSEIWEFLPGQIVKGEVRISRGKEIISAVSAADQI